MPIGRIGFLLLLANFVVVSVVSLLPVGDGAIFSVATGLLSISCNADYWLDSSRVMIPAVGIPLITAGIACFLLLGTYSTKELMRTRNGASVSAACWLTASAATLLSYSFFPCGSFYLGFSEAGGSSAHRNGHLLLRLLTENQPVFNLLYAFMFCGISYCVALGLKLFRSSLAA
ncbi:hypothetical protein IB274_05450 [Pseudomonas sp. PDM18]|uniref:hypothetical protein n=1 Tax=unclassified Pseudomonas TaxID=196821 RepID=UPI00177CD81E|nr:hypothetical protein [Pseudomonas sp. PDM18]MBD9676137.1 hypothetical protein [Pseudomonas sp. PDM18]